MPQKVTELVLNGGTVPLSVVKHSAQDYSRFNMASTIQASLSRWLGVILALYFLHFSSVIAGPLPNAASLRETPISSVVNLGYSKYEGTVLDAGVNQYLGMRYAAPPVGNRRWRAPQDPHYESDVQDATQVR
jgi:hypothetical protein